MEVNNSQPIFTFKIENKKYTCAPSLIAFLSPKICKQITSQQSENPYLYKIATLKDPNGIFGQFMALINGFQIDISIDNAPFLDEIAQQLEIAPLREKIQKFIQSIDVTPSNECQLLNAFSSCNLTNTKLITLINSHFSLDDAIKNPQSPIYSLSIESFDQLFSSKSFSPSSQHSFFDFLCKLVEIKGQTYSQFFGYCDTVSLEAKQVSTMIDILSFDNLPTKAVLGLEPRFIQEVRVQSDDETASTQPTVNSIKTFPQTKSSYDKVQQKPKSSTEEMRQHESKSLSYGADDGLVVESSENNILTETRKFKHYPVYDEDEDFRGIFSFIKQACPSMGMRNQYLVMKCGGDKENYLNSLLDFDNYIQFHWDNYSRTEGIQIKNAWITIQFPYHKVYLEDYTFGVKRDPSRGQPKSWRVEGISINPITQKEQLELIDDKKNQDAFRDNQDMCRTFHVSYPRKLQDVYFTGFKFTFLEGYSQSSKKKGGYNSSGSDKEIILCALELYGTITRRDKK